LGTTKQKFLGAINSKSLWSNSFGLFACSAFCKSSYRFNP